MSKLFIIGDTHFPHSITKIKPHVWTKQNSLTKDDYTLVGGDCGLIWDNWETGQSVESNPADKCWSREELFWYKWLNERNYTTLWVDGNHENFDRIKTYPVTEWHGGRVQMISESIIHLMRGEIYEINGLSVFTFGGAISVDRGPALGKEESEKEQYRARDEHICWWPEEEPSQEERNNALNNLAAHGEKVDIIVTHEAPAFYPLRKGIPPNSVSAFLQQLWETVEFERWFCGHHHTDEECGKLRVLFNDIVEVGTGGIE